MPHYKDSEGHLHFLEDASFEYMLPPGCVRVPDSKVPNTHAEDAKKLQIIALESQITPRRIREALLSGDHSFIESIEAQIAALRTQLS